MKKHTEVMDFSRITEHYLMGAQGRTEIMPADFALLFGSPHVLDELAKTAAHYYYEGYFPLIVASGCGHWGQDIRRLSSCACEEEFNRLQRTEADQIIENLMRYNVPKEAIIKEPNATNTQQNIENTKNLLERSGIETNSCIAFGDIKAGTRFVQTMARRWPEVFTMAVGVNSYNVPIAKWYTDDAFKQDVLLQYAKLKPYRERGLLLDVGVEHINKVVNGLREDKINTSPKLLP